MVSLGTQPANRKSGFGHSSPTGARAQDLSRQPARPDLWGARVSNDPGLPDHLQARGHDQRLELGLGIDKDVDQREMTRCRGCRLATTSDYARLLLHGGSFLGASPQGFPTGRITRPAGSRRLKFQQPLEHPQVCHAPTELDSTLRAGRRRRATAEDAVKVASEDGRPALGVEGNLIKRRALGVEHGVLPASWEERGV